MKYGDLLHLLIVACSEAGEMEEMERWIKLKKGAV